MWFKVVLLVASLIASAGHSSAASWERYANGSMGYSVSVPTDRFAVEKETEGRVSYRDIYGSAQLDVFGVTNPERLTVAEFQEMMEAADPNRRITYRAGGRSWFVLSGYLEDEVEPTIFYAKFMLNNRGTTLSAFEISYPQTDRAKFDPLVEQIEDSLTSPR
jgi:hypothetical protein